MPATPSYDALVRQVADLEKQIVELQKIKTAVHRTNDADRERRFQKIFSLSQDLIAYVDGHYTYRMINDLFCRDKGKNHDEIIGRTVAELIGQELFSQTVKAQLDRCLSGEIVRYRGWLEYPSVGRRYRDVTNFPDRLADGTISGVFIVIQDLTDIKLEQEAKNTEQALLSHILTSLEFRVS